MSTALIILNYNNYEDTINCIESVEQYNTSPIKYIIVDNGSTRSQTVDFLHDYLIKRFPANYSFYNSENDSISHPLSYVNFISSKNNDGYAQGNNKGLKLAYADNEIEHVMILNNDVLFTEDIIGKLILKMRKLPQCAIVSPILYKTGMKELDYNCARKNHTDWEIINTYLMLYKNIFGYITRKADKRYILLQQPEYLTKDSIEIELPSGSCMLMKKSVMKKIGGFDPHTFLYFEENILYKKISSVGLSNYLIPSCRCIHLGASSTNKSSSFFIDKASLDSASYYLKNFCSLSLLQKICWTVGKRMFMWKLHLRNYLQN